MKPFKIVTKEDMINQFTKGKDFNEIMDLLPHYEDEDYKEIYSDMIEEYLFDPVEQILMNHSEYVDNLREGFKYLYGEYPEDITEESLKGVTRELVTERAEAALEDEE
jgi:hypothetical protein